MLLPNVAFLLVHRLHGLSLFAIQKIRLYGDDKEEIVNLLCFPHKLRKKGGFKMVYTKYVTSTCLNYYNISGPLQHVSEHDKSSFQSANIL